MSYFSNVVFFWVSFENKKEANLFCRQSEKTPNRVSLAMAPAPVSNSFSSITIELSTIQEKSYREKRSKEDIYVTNFEV